MSPSPRLEQTVDNTEFLDENSFVPPIVEPNASLPMNDAELNFSDNVSMNSVQNQPNFVAPQIGNNELLLAFSVRHKISDSALLDLLKLIPLLDLNRLPKNLKNIYDYSAASSYFFCECPLNYKNEIFNCLDCRKKSKNFFYVPNLLNRLGEIIPRYFNSGSIVEITLYTDGISTFQKSRYSIWPIYLVINKIPFNLRYKLKKCYYVWNMVWNI